jgi:hypothetical protein
MRALTVYESIRFERGKDPKQSMGIGNSFENIRKGSVIKLLKDDGLEVENVEAGNLLKIKDIGEFWEDGSRRIEYVLINTRGEEMNGGWPESWFMSPDFFYEYFDVIKL